mmetsp:Transcript_50/g.175  ORF Transcript_50/g.175 Transcript_50/m.175 type:complete len:101 (-) Transcript_50:1938-2240(-)
MENHRWEPRRLHDTLDNWCSSSFRCEFCKSLWEANDHSRDLVVNLSIHQHPYTIHLCLILCTSLRSTMTHAAQLTEIDTQLDHASVSSASPRHYFGKRPR